eukprot:gene12316-12452_t
MNGTIYYINSATGNDAFNGLTPSTAWKTLTKVSNIAYAANGFKAGDQIWLTGTFTQQLYIDYALSYGSVADPIVITTDPSAFSPAVIKVSRLHAILLYSATGSNLGIKISNLRLMGDNTTTTAGQTTGGIFLWQSSVSAVAGLFIDKVVATGFTEGGIVTGRDSTAGWITNVTVIDSLAYGNPGYPGISRPVGSGIVLGGVKDALVERCEAYGNGGWNTSPGGGPVGIWAWDADRVIIRSCSSHDNLSQNNDGGGFDLDGGVSNSLIENCTSSNNYGPGYEACGFQGANNANNVVRHSISSGDGYGKRFGGFAVAPMGDSVITNLQVYGMTINITTPGTTACQYWGNDYSALYGLWLIPGEGSYSGISWAGNTVICHKQGITYNSNLTCGSGAKPVCNSS